jgi:hypothetical protein
MSRRIVHLSIAVLVLALGTRVVFFSAVPGGHAPQAGASTDRTRAGTGPARLLLNEVVFTPSPGQPPWVELVNAGGAPARLDGLTLENQAAEKFMLPVGMTVPSGGVLVVRFDGQSGHDDSTVHGAPTTFLARDGLVQLSDASGRLDRIAWGETQPGASSLSRGGFDEGPQPGMSLGRVPRTTAPDPLEWVPYSPQQTTPGKPNPQPGVEILLPMDGAIVGSASASLSWYTVPRAVQYHVQVAADASFGSPVLDQTVESPPVAATNLQAGRYVWRVQAIDADGGGRSSYSPASSLTVRAPRVAASRIPSLIDYLLTPMYAQTQQPNVDDHLPIALDVPLIRQHKDTRMLLLEEPEARGATTHSWDRDHETNSPRDPADNLNSAPASVAMLTQFYGGHLSQDRINYEVFNGDSPGPEGDLGWGHGYNRERLTKAMAFAFGVPPRVDPAIDDLTMEALWSARIEGRIPGIACKRHCVVVAGYGGTQSLLIINDPGVNGMYLAPLSVLRGATVFTMTRPNSGDPKGPAPSAEPMLVRPKSDEPEISRDSDGDGVVDFDESQRFHTNPHSKDTDNDDLPDKEDIKASVHDKRHGYAYGGNGRDFDNDGTPMELDPDSDGGGCLDGLEDRNHNGIFEKASSETDNFEKKDDPCITGSQVFIENSLFTEPDGGTQKLENQTTITFVIRDESGMHKGRAFVAASFRQELNDPPRNGVACPHSIDRSSTKYVVDIQGTVVKMPDGTAAVSVAPPAEWTPPMLKFVSTCEGRPPFDQPGISFGIGGTLRGGVFREHVDLPLDREGATGRKYYDTEIRQSEASRSR